MNETLQIIQICIGIIIIILFLVFTVLVLQITKLIKLVTGKLDKLEVQITEVKEKVIPAIESVQTVVASVNNVVTSVNKIVTVVEANTVVLTNTVEKIDGAVDDIIRFEQNLQTKAGIPIMETINSYSALVTGVKAFFNKLGEKRNEKYSGGKRSYYEDGNSLIHPDNIYYEDNSELDDINKELDLVRRKLEEMRKD